MKKYQFSLQRLRDFKVQMLDKEKKTLGTLKKRREEIFERLRALEAFRQEKTAELQRMQEKGAAVSELVSLSFLIESTRKQIEDQAAELRKADELVEAQRKVVLTIYQEKTGMDKLEERQLEEYRLLEAKEQESEVMQAITNNLVRESTA